MLLSAASLAIGACAKNTSAKPEEKWEIEDPNYEDFQALQETSYAPFSEKFKQVVYDINQTNVIFHASDFRGYTITDLRGDDILLSENGKPVDHFQLRVSLV